MMKRIGNKRGQFYLLGAIIIIVIILGFVGVTNFAKTKQDLKIYDLKEELNIESGNVIDYGLVTGTNTDMQALLTTFAGDYSTYAGADKNLYFVFGDTKGITVASYQDIVSGTVGVTIGTGGQTSYRVEKRSFKSEKYSGISKDDNVKVVINGVEYTFQVKEGQNFYFVISQTVGGDTYVVQN
jgi:hypothetical protein